MPSVNDASRSEDVIGDEAAAWFSRMRAPDAAQDAERLEAWLSTDPAHRNAYDRISRQWDQTVFLANSQTGKSRNLAAAFAKDRSLNRYTAVAGVAVIAAAGLVAFGLDLSERVAPSPAPSPIVAQAESSSTRRMIALPDGSRATLDPGASIRVAFTAGERRLRLLSGRARFTVAHDPVRSFVVDAAGGTITARGTVFDVAIEKKLVRVLLLQGQVEVKPSHAASGKESAVVLAPGQEVRFPPEPNTSVSAAMAKTSRPMMLEMDGSSLADAVAEINRHNRIHIRLGATVDGGLRVSGAYRARDPRGFAQAIASAFQLVAEQGSDGITIRAKLGPE